MFKLKPSMYFVNHNYYGEMTFLEKPIGPLAEEENDSNVFKTKISVEIRDERTKIIFQLPNFFLQNKEPNSKIHIILRYNEEFIKYYFDDEQLMISVCSYKVGETYHLFGTAYFEKTDGHTPIRRSFDVFSVLNPIIKEYPGQ